ncbi:hypothetical protein D3C84_1262580 [compost metagenome]
MLGQVQAHLFDMLVRAQANQSFDHFQNDPADHEAIDRSEQHALDLRDHLTAHCHAFD